MQTLAATATLLLGSLAFARAENTVTVQPVNYVKIQKEIRTSALAAAEQAQIMARLATQTNADASSIAVYAANLKASVNQVLERASRFAITMPYETFNSSVGNQLQQDITRLATTTQTTIEFLNNAPHKVQTGEYQALLRQIQGICEDMAE